MANFGKKPESSKIGHLKSYKVLIFASLFGGVFVGISYRSGLNATFQAVENVYPFSDLETLSKTNYRYDKLRPYSDISILSICVQKILGCIPQKWELLYMI